MKDLFSHVRLELLQINTGCGYGAREWGVGLKPACQGRGMNMEDGHLDLPDLLANVTYCLLHCGLFMMVSCMHEHLDSRQVELDSNCLEAVNILNAKSMVMKDSALVLSIRNLISRERLLRVDHIFRASNGIADRLAAMGRRLSTG
ncbi:hypothetical protein V6N12_019807 [Hibiscus sabdariffa]|uniref:RNase H type-1 domain-containing protein n=1 Tax=Hibiscus sabdariffa TaxID=183260 RepID=A0ABR2ARG1_9ROSI